MRRRRATSRSARGGADRAARSATRDPGCLLDTDGDGVPDLRDRDSDNDGLPDALESQGFEFDANRDGEIDGFVDADGNGRDDGVDLAAAMSPGGEIVPEDVDGDGMPDHLDTDTDNDGIEDVVEGGSTDEDEDGVVDTMRDANRNGIPDSVDVFYTGGADADGDGIDDEADADVAGGPVSGQADRDFDGIVDASDPDADGDGYADVLLGDGGDARAASGHGRQRHGRRRRVRARRGRAPRGASTRASPAAGARSARSRRAGRSADRSTRRCRCSPPWRRCGWYGAAVPPRSRRRVERRRRAEPRRLTCAGTVTGAGGTGAAAAPCSR